MIFDRWAVVRVLFAFADRYSSKNRPAPSRVRFKLFTLDQRLVCGQVGVLSVADGRRVSEALAGLLGTGRERQRSVAHLLSVRAWRCV